MDKYKNIILAIGALMVSSGVLLIHNDHPIGCGFLTGGIMLVGYAQSA